MSRLCIGMQEIEAIMATCRRPRSSARKANDLGAMVVMASKIAKLPYGAQSSPSVARAGAKRRQARACRREIKAGESEINSRYMAKHVFAARAAGGGAYAGGIEQSHVTLGHCELWRVKAKMALEV